MRYGMLFLVTVATLAGCAHVSHQDLETGLEVTYTGPAKGAVDIVHATDSRPYDMASKAMDKGMTTSLAREADGDVRFNGGYGYTYGATSVGGYAPANTGYVPGQGFVTGPPQSGLPPLATTVVSGAPQGSTSAGLVPCPTDRSPTTSAEQDACTYAGVRVLAKTRSK